MPFSGNCNSFDSSNLEVLNNNPAVYGLFKRDLPFRSHHSICLHVGRTDGLRTSMLEHYNHPPIADVTNFFVETTTPEEQQVGRQEELIREFNPIGNQTSEASYSPTPEVQLALESF